MKNYLNGVKKTVQKQNEWCVGKKKNPEDVQSSTLEYFNGPDNFFCSNFRHIFSSGFDSERRNNGIYI